MTTRTLPESRETERALLHTLLTNPQRVIHHCRAAGLVASDFATDRHGVIYDAISRMLLSGQDVDDISLINQLRRENATLKDGNQANALTYVGGPAGVFDLGSPGGVVALARQYADELVAQGTSRELVHIGEYLGEQGEQLESVSVAVSEAERRLAKARDRAEGRHDGARTSDVGELVEAFATHYTSEQVEAAIPFDLAALNAIGGGMFAGDIVIVGARSGVGKSWTGLAAIETAVQAGARSALFSMEMPALQMIRRLVAMGGHRLTPIRQRNAKWDEIATRTTEIGEWTGKLDIFDGATNVDRIQSVLASARIDGNPYRLVVVDHVHLLQVPGRDYRLGLNVALTQIKHMAIEHGCTIMLLAQLRRPSTERVGNPRPTIHDLRESGGIGDIADYVLLLHRDQDEAGNHLPSGVLIVEKVRDGAGASEIPVRFDTRSYRFKTDTGFMAGMPHGREIA